MVDRWRISLNPAGRVTCWLLGGAWVLVGASKLAELKPATSPGRLDRWIDQFPTSLLASAAAVECLVGTLLVFGIWRSGLVGALMLLATFSITLLALPVTPGLACGCAGSVGRALGLDQADPLVRNMAWSAVHLFAASLLVDLRKRVQE